MDDNVEDFYTLLENFSKSLNEMEEVLKSASSSSNATTKSLADIKGFFNMSVDVVLLNEDYISKFRKAAAPLVDKTNILGEDKCDRLKKFISEIDREIDRLNTAADKEKKRTALEEKRSLHVGTLETYRSAFQTRRDEMRKVVSEHEDLKKKLRDYERLMIKEMPSFKKVYSQQKSSIDTEISGFQGNEQLLQKESKEIDRLRKEPSIDWSGLINAFYN